MIGFTENFSEFFRKTRNKNLTISKDNLHPNRIEEAIIVSFGSIQTTRTRTRKSKATKLYLILYLWSTPDKLILT